MPTVKNMRAYSLSRLLSRRRRLLKGLPELGAVLRGSLIERHKMCGKAGCRCLKGELHGPYRYLSSKGEEGTELIYVPSAWLAWTSERLENFRRLELALAELSEINRELLRRRADQPG